MKEEINICGNTWKIKIDSAEGQDDNNGSSYNLLQEIRIDPNIHHELKDSTLVHEILHACANFVGMDDAKLTEEEWVSRIAPTLTRVLKDNILFSPKHK